MDQAAAAKTTAPPIRLTAQGQLPPDQMAFDDDLMAALNNVNDTARACLLLRTIDGMEYAEISKLLDIPAGTAMSHVHRSRQFLRKRLTAPSASPHKIHHPSTTPKRSPS
jgi:RNA polymerase sigma-70 factor (ECF subfamily)